MIDPGLHNTGLQDSGLHNEATARRGFLPAPLARVMSLLPLQPLEFAACRIFENTLTRRPRMLSRLGEHATKRFAIDPVDCPFAFLLEPRVTNPRLTVVPSIQPQAWDARIAAPLLVLLGLVDGRYDGDALFFTRDLTIEGDTAAVLALRNAIEDAEIDPAEALGMPEVAAPFVTASYRTLATKLRVALGAPAEVEH
ncbi:MAG TPA: SCP2 sterol-binding domain-containing protein [Hyphomicrobium sp.]|nr:SCP2 sterol-binding domain-containing protein [Hyphomicrobium sp.]